MDHIDRVRCAIEHREPDKVPKGEWFIDPLLLRKMLGKSCGDLLMDELHLWECLGMDIKATKGGYEKSKILDKDDEGREIFEDVWGCVWKESGEGFLTPCLVEAPIKEIENVYDFKFPSLEEFDVEEIKWWVENSDFFIFSIVSGGFERAASLIGGFEKYLIYLKTNFRELKFIIEKYIEFQAELAKRYIQAGAHGIIISDDIAYNNGPFFSPQVFREFLLPLLQREVNSIKSFKDVPVFFHSDGNLNLLMDDILTMDIDGIHPLEKHAGMNIADMKKKFGDRICLMGNVDTSYTLPYGTPEEVEKEVKELIEKVAPGGGFILRASNLLTKDIPKVNVLAMYYAAEKFGLYKRV